MKCSFSGNNVKIPRFLAIIQKSDLLHHISIYSCCVVYPPKRISADFLCIFSIKPVDYATFTGSLWKTCILCLRAENLVVIQDRVFLFLSLGSFQKINRTCSRKMGEFSRNSWFNRSYIHAHAQAILIFLNLAVKSKDTFQSVEKGIDAESNISHIASEK